MHTELCITGPSAEDRSKYVFEIMGSLNMKNMCVVSRKLNCVQLKY